MYKILGVEPSSTYAEIKDAYFTLAKKHHPDMNRSEDSAEKFRAIQSAYEILSNQAKRSIYDSTGHFVDLESSKVANKKYKEGIIRPPGGLRWYKSYKHPQTFYDLMKDKGGMKDIQFDIKIDLEISFIEAVAGFTKIVRFLREELCLLCQGNGCELCRDTGMVMRKLEALVDFEPADERKIIVFPEYGHYQQRSDTFADLYVHIKVKKHPIFTFKRPDIHTTHQLTISEAILGTTLKVNTIFGVKEVQVPASTNHGDKIRIKGYGARLPRIGDHVCDLEITLKKVLDSEQEAILRQAYQLYKKNL
ncbi:unnamed protein product [Moneuplotes crassus]|uniref:J domain-containing protein n=1 Tax=Euplotes crassus TaxID=5936 RepID=A0AAD1XN74_EUPCR|nr:unnamed protein product [Moneuplotes crassus]